MKAFESLGRDHRDRDHAIKLGVPGEEEFQGRGVSYCATCDGWFFADLGRRGDRGWRCRHRGRTDTREYRPQGVASFIAATGLRAQQILQERAFKNGRMEFLWNKVPVRISGRRGRSNP